MIFKKISPVVLILVLFVLLIQSRSPNIPDPDAFYHIRHSWIYRTSGLFNSAFPWAQYSSIGDIGSDLWYGFHIAIIPLTYFDDLVIGIKWGGLLMMFISLMIAFLALKRLGIRWPLFWTLVFALASADILYRLTMLRPHPITISLALLIFTFFADLRSSVEVTATGESNTKPRPRFLAAIFIFAAFFSWLHLSLAWVPILLVAAVSFFRFIKKAGIEWVKILALLAGLAIGWLARPNPFGGLKLAYIQVLKLLVEKQGGLPLRFGNELLPFVWVNFVDILIAISALMLAAIVMFLWMIRKREVVLIPSKMQAALWASLVLSVFFFILSFLLARRSNEFFIGFGVIFMGLVATLYFNLPEGIRRSFFSGWLMRLIGLVAVVALVYGPIKTVYRYDTYIANAFFWSRFRDISLWLKENTRPGEIVFNLQWDRFAQLFFWNQHNYYVNGMDPIFEFSHNPALYWKNHHLYIDKFFVQDGIAKVCGEIRCTIEMVEDIYKILKDDFGVSYIFIEKFRNPQLYDYLGKDARFKKVFETESEAVFQIFS